MALLSPVMEGFENPTMATVFREMLKVSPVVKSNSRGPKTAPGASVAAGGSCPPATSSASPSASTGSSSSSTPSEKISFLKSILSEEKKTADSLMESAKKMRPVAQKLAVQKKAYDAAFETDLVAPMPNTSGTLQGFTLVFFVVAFFSLAIVASVLTNQATGNVSSALSTLGGFFIAFCVSLGVISKFG